MRRPILKSKHKRWSQGAKEIFSDYLAHSTIHGVHYITEKNRSWFEKFWWISVFCVCVCCCGKLVSDAWNINPIIIRFSDKPTSIWKARKLFDSF
jgi:hypothetical protein